MEHQLQIVDLHRKKEVQKQKADKQKTSSISENPALKKGRIKSSLSNPAIEDEDENSDGVSKYVIAE